MMTRIIEAWNFRPVIRVFICFLFCGFPATLTAQQNFDDTDLLPAGFHAARREALRARLPENGVAVFFANPVRIRTNDVDYQYVQDPDFYYLTGFTEPHSVLFVFQRPIEWEGQSVTDILFIQDRDPKTELWTGRISGKDFVMQKLGFQAVAFNYQLDTRLPSFKGIEQVWVKWPADIGPGSGRKNSLNWMNDFIRSRFEGDGMDVKTAPLTDAMTDLRQIKQPEELRLMQKAIDITLEGHASAIRALKPGMTEYQAQAIAEYVFKHGGSEYPGYGSIAGGGNNSCVLHYVMNRKTLSDGELLLMDMGAEYHGYTADVTRTVPVNGKFSEPQRMIYQLVLDAQVAAIELCKTGNSFFAPHQKAEQLIAEGLMQLGVISTPDEAQRYFPHGTSHYLGLEVHDPGNMGPLKAGMVITVEPGIYIPEGSPCDRKWWGIGVRIEDDVLITDNQPVVMSVALPKTIEALEKLMAEPSLFDAVK